jgi:hypothetical protein
MTDDIRFNRTLNLAPGVVDEVAPGVRRILVDNPSPFTFKGTRRRCNDAEVDVYINREMCCAEPKSPLHHSRMVQLNLPPAPAGGAS